MKRIHSIAIWLLILIPSVILAMYIGQSMDSDTAALALGAIIGIMGAACAAGITFLIRDERHRRQREEARRPATRPAPQPPAPTYIDGQWREWHPSPQPPAPSPQLEAPTRAITIRRS